MVMTQKGHFRSLPETYSFEHSRVQSSYMKGKIIGFRSTVGKNHNLKQMDLSIFPLDDGEINANISTQT